MNNYSIPTQQHKTKPWAYFYNLNRYEQLFNANETAQNKTVSIFCEILWSSKLCPDGSILLFAQCSISLSSSWRRMWRYWTSKMLVRWILSSVCPTLSPFHRLCYGAVLYFIIIIKSKVWSLFHSLGLGHETIVCVYVFLYSYKLR